MQLRPKRSRNGSITTGLNGTTSPSLSYSIVRQSENKLWGLPIDQTILRCLHGMRCTWIDVPPRDRDIAMVFQNYALYPHMSVFDRLPQVP